MTSKDKSICIVGLGKMGKGIGERLLKKGWQIVVYDKNK